MRITQKLLAITLILVVIKCNWEGYPRTFASDATSESQYGVSVSVSEGNLFVGAPTHSFGASKTGTGYVYEFDYENGWEYNTLISGTGGDYSEFGKSVSVYSINAFIGEPYRTGGATESGMVTAYYKSGTAWYLRQTINPPSAIVGGNFGSSVGMSTSYGVVGAPGNNTNGNRSGSAQVYKLYGASWIWTSSLIGDDTTVGDEFGSAVAIFDPYIAVGAPYHNTVGTASGYVYIFTRSVEVWSQTAKLSPSNLAAFDKFGSSLSMYNNLLLIGAPNHNSSASAAGSAYLFTRSVTWSQTSEIVPNSLSAGSRFGSSVSISGNFLVIGAPGFSDYASSSGAAFLFEYRSSNWQLAQTLLPHTYTSFLYFGSSVSLDGGQVVVGCFGDPSNGTQAGSIYTWNYVFQFPQLGYSNHLYFSFVLFFLLFFTFF
ncbi:hypothetical protein M0811_08176 [Anaeramoeba ignava]|uniref:Uncharacterized protein n=1 Tax=Anaeramoeba ignava TaxID=1746090 RepID=A0A9Q0RBV1_ANAIG|nr:hypothetical protein M0811_08176 [Anaeramoeba ignava]